MTAASPSLATPRPRLKLFTLVGIILALAAPLIAWILDGYFRVWFDRNGKVFAGALSFWVMTAIVLLLTRFEAAAGHTLSERINLKRLKLRETLIVLIIAFVTLFVVNLAFVILARTIFPTEVSTAPALALPVPLMIFVYLTGSITEEILYRGYALERLQRMTGNWWISGLITGALFVGFHVPVYPMAHIVGYIIPATIVLTLIYAWKRNLSHCIIFHCVLNMPILLAAILIPLVTQA